MIKYFQPDLHFDTAQMQAELNALQQKQWPLHYQAKHFEGEWSSLALRSIDGNANNSIIHPSEATIYHDTEILAECPYMQSILQQFECRLLAVRLLKLSAGSVIKEHKDADLCFEKGLARFHIPVITNDAVEFFLDKERLQLKEGECWYCNFNLPHSLANRSDTDRIHLVIDAEVNDWIKNFFDKKGLQRKDIEDPEEVMDETVRKETIRHLRMMNTDVSNRLADEMEKNQS